MSSSAQTRSRNGSHPELHLLSPSASLWRRGQPHLERARAHQPVLVEGLKNTGLPTLRQSDVHEQGRRCRALHGPNQAASGAEGLRGRRSPAARDFRPPCCQQVESTAVEDEMAFPKGFDPAGVFRSMVRMRLVEQALPQAWADGLVPGEYHSGIGEEGVYAGVLANLSGRDAMALDHRNTSPLVGRGTDITKIMLEVFGSEEGLNLGKAGHMHLMDPDLPAAADGIVGASGPLAVGAAIANQRLHPGRIAVAFHGEAAMNQGMLMESYNLAVAWRLPVLFVCKDNKWSITTHSADVTGGTLTDRAKAFGLRVRRARGDRVESVYAAAGDLIGRARSGGGPGFLYVSCHRPAGHFEGDPLVRLLKNPRPQRAGRGVDRPDQARRPRRARLHVAGTDGSGPARPPTAGRGLG